VTFVLVSVGADCKRQGAFVRKLIAHRELMKALCYTPGTDAVWSAGLDRCVAVWDANVRWTAALCRSVLF
jgi:hypothetical protein